MPANKNAVTRYYILDRLLANRYHHYSTEDLLRHVNQELAETEQPEVSRRTIELDLRYLEYESPFMAEIEHYQIDDVSQHTLKTVKKCCHRYADPNFSIFKKEMTDDEKYLLNEALSVLGQFDGLPKLEGLENLRKALKVKTDRQIVSFTKNPLQNTAILGELFTAISQQQVVELHYRPFDAAEELCLVVHPYLLKEYNRRWYLIAATDDGGLLQHFALDRIVGLVPLPARKYAPYDGNLNERFDDIVGVTLYDDRPVQKVVFWVSDNSKEYVATKPLHESQRNIRNEHEQALRQQYPALTGGCFFSIECIENYELMRELCSFGRDLIVLLPSDIQEKICARINDMVNEYNAVRK